MSASEENSIPWSWLTEKLWLVLGSLLGSSVLVLVYMYHLSVKFETHHIERQAQFNAVSAQLKTLDDTSRMQSVVITELRVALASLQVEINALRRDLGRLETK